MERYSNVETVRWIVDISRSGDRVVLDDGSMWHVVPSHRMISGNWPRTLKVRVEPVQGRLHTLRAEAEREVQAVYQGYRPFRDGPEGLAGKPSSETAAEPSRPSPEPYRTTNGEASKSDG